MYFLGFVAVSFGVLVFLRKLQYDRTQYNLLDLKKEIGGEVRRTSFLQQPVYRGKYKSIDFQISFSGDKVGGERVSYITYSFVQSFKKSLTVGTRSWFAEMDVNVDAEPDMLTIGEFALRSNSKTLLKTLAADTHFVECLEGIGNFAYMMFSDAGLMFEVKSAQIVADIEHKNVIKTLNLISDISRKL